MRVFPSVPLAMLLIASALVPACKEQGKTSGSSSAIAVPDHFEIDFDELFELQKPCVMTPELLESKAAALALVPREKLCMPVNIGSQRAHWFSQKNSPVHNPVYSVFKSSLHPNFLAVVWQDQAMERFYCVYPAEKDQELPEEMLADMDRSLGTAHTFNALLKQFEWELPHYSVNAKYSTSVGKGDPAFLINVRNKAVQAVAQVRMPSSQPAATTPGSPLNVDLDQLIDWSAPASVSMLEFDAKIEALEKTTGQILFRRTSGVEDARFFEPARSGRQVTYTFLGGQYRISGGYISWKKEGPISLIDLVQMKTPDGADVEPMATISMLDKRFGRVHVAEANYAYVWNTPSFNAVFLKYGNAPGYGLRFSQPRTGTLAEQSVRSTTPAASPRPQPEAQMAEVKPEPKSPELPKGPPQSTTSAFKLRLTQVNGLLISPLANGEESGHVTKMTLTALPSRGTQESWLEFNQDVGGSMRRCLNEVSKLSQLRNDVWPVGYSLQIGFEDKYIEKDGPSAAVACALLVESALTGKKWDPSFAVTGDLNADGSVQPIGGVRAKIRGATNGSCKMVAVPSKNERAVADLLLLDGPAPLVGITVFGIKTFDDAVALASPERSEGMKLALADFDAMRTVMMRDPRQIMPLLRTPHASARLQALLFVAPDCYSAKYLLLHAQGKSARTLSLGGSIEAAQSSAQAIVNSIDNDVTTAMSSLKPDEVGTSLNKLRNLRPILDQRVWPYVDAVTDYGDVIRSAIVNPVRSGARYLDLVSKAKKAAGSASAAFNTLMNTSQVREELGL